RPEESAPATLSSEVPAAVPSVAQRPLLPLESVPLNSSLLPNTVRSNGFRPPVQAPATLNSEVPAAVPSVTQRPKLLLASVPVNSTLLPNTVRSNGFRPGDRPEEDAPVTLSSEVPAAVPSVTQRPALPLESTPENRTSLPKTVN